MGQKEKIPLRVHMRGTAFWIDCIVLAALWIITISLPERVVIFEGASLANLTKILAVIASLQMMGFFTYYLLEEKAGLLIQGFLGGFVSSTMTFLQFTQKNDFINYHPWTVSRALILATIAMLIESIFIIISINAQNAMILARPFVVQLGVLLLILVFSKKPKSTMDMSKSFTDKIIINEPIIWKKVIYFAVFIISLIYFMRYVSEHLSMPYLATSFLVSLLEAHGVLAAAMAQFQDATNLQEASYVVVAILFGNVISKTFFVLKSENKTIRKPVLLSLYSSMLLAVASVFLF